MSEESVITVGNRPLMDYIISIVVLLNQGTKKIIIKGKGDKISKAVAVYNAIKDRMGDAIQLEGVEIGSEKRNYRYVSFIKITISRVL